MRILKNLPLRQKQMLLMMATSGLALLLACGAFSVYEVTAFRDSLKQNLATLADIVDHGTAAALDFNDPKSAEETLTTLQADPDIIGAWIYTKDGQGFAHYDRANDGIIFAPPAGRQNGTVFEGRRLILCRPIMSKGENAGTLYMESDMGALDARLVRYAWIAGLVFLVSWLIVFALSHWLQRLVSDPILKLAQVARMVAQGKNYSLRATKQSDDELGQLVEGFNEMLEQIQQRDAALEAARGDLESRVKERTQELAQSLSLLHATLESTADGIVVVDLAGKVVSYNTKFAAIWQFPEGMLERGDATEMRVYTAGQLKDPAPFLKRIQELQANPEAEVFDTVELKDGRTFERYIFPQRVGGACVGAVINWRDITERKRAVDELRGKSAFLEAQLNSSPDGILVVDNQQKRILQNQRLLELFRVPKPVAENDDDAELLRYTTSQVKAPEEFAERVKHLYAHPDEIGRDEIELVDGTILDRYTSPVRSPGGYYYGRIWAFRDITERKRADNALRASNEKFHQLADNITDVFWIRSPDLSEVHYISPAFEKIWGRSVASLYAHPQQWTDFILPEDRERVNLAFAALAGNTPSLDMEYRIVRPDGEIRWVRVRGFQVRDITGKLIRHTGIVADVTERKGLEARLLLSQKMETVGKLAGGIAHEFNSILTAIIGQSELQLNDLPADSPLVKSATEIHKAAERAATLTRQLLAYGRKQILQPELLDLNAVLGGMENTLRHLAGRGIEVCFGLATGLKSVKADLGQIEQVIVNITMNGAEAMPNGGKLLLETANVSFDQESVGRYPELKPGEYVMLAVTDTGIGMSEPTKLRVFEPFFTTKGVGQGTGLGLSTCYGIVKQSGGHISVYSELGRGTTFKIYLPQDEAQVKLPLPPPDASGLPRGSETILLVEDDPALREMAATLLRRLGYTVLAAADGVKALSLTHEPGSGHIDLLFTDVVMPHMSGKELADRVRALYPRTRILFTSAYTENAIVHQGVLERGVLLLQKPFTPSALARKLREVLDEARKKV